MFKSQGAISGLTVWLVVGCACAALVAYWTWLFLLRPSAALPIVIESAPEKLARQVEVRHLFGTAAAAVGGVAPFADVANLILAGIISSGSAKRGVAIILVDGKKTVTARVGQEILPDVVLSRVAPDHVELVRRGQQINLRLATKK